MTNQPANENDPSAMPVISYAPVEDDQSINKLLRRAIGWFLILEYGWWALSEINRNVSMLLQSPLGTPAISSANNYLSLIFMTVRVVCYGGLVSAGFLLLKRSPISIRLIRILLICQMVLSALVQVGMAVSFAMEIYQGARSYRIEFLISSLMGIPGQAILPLFLLILTSRRIAAIYK